MGWAPDKAAGWGGRRADGANGLSCRICWNQRQEIIMYTYHADQNSRYGDGFKAMRDGKPVRWEAGRWYCMEVHMKLNTPAAGAGEQGKRDGLVELWMDGEQIGREEGLRFRDIPTLKIDRLFVNAYFGGWHTSPKDQRIFYDNFVMATEYIGPTVAVDEAQEGE
jgi:hypothetical protein